VTPDVQQRATVENTGPALGVDQGRPAILGRKYMVSSSHYLASQAGMRMFERGGTAVDAGVAAGVALNVIERHLTDFGGVAPVMVWRPGMGAPEVLDGVGRWPASLDLATYRTRHGDDMPPGLPRSVAPAACDAWLTALARHGTMSLADILAPSIELCEKGFPVYADLRTAIARLEAQLRKWPTTAAVFLPGGRVPEVGELLIQSDLAALFRRLIAAESSARSRGRAEAIVAARDEFYRGSISKEISTFMRAEGGAIDEADLAAQHITIDQPAHTTYRGIDVYATGPWSQGPLVPMTLNLLEGYDVASAGSGSFEHLHHFAESMKLACADREAFFGDPEHVDVPLRGMLSKEYANERRRLIRDDQAFAALPPPGDPFRHEGRSGPAGYVPPPRAGGGGPDTSYVCALDAAGNAFSATPSDAGLYAPLVPGLGIVVSHRGVQFWNEPGHPQAIAPRRRPRLTPNPAMLMSGGRVLMPFGCPGEDAQCQAMVQVVCGVVDFGLNVQAAIELPRVISRSFPSSFHPHGYHPGELHVEARIAPEVRGKLAAAGHRIVDLPAWANTTAMVCAVRRRPDGSLEGGADPRRESYAIGW